MMASTSPVAPRIAVIVPMYNEERNAERCVRAIQGVLSSVPDTKLYAVNDGSKDKTLDVLRSLESQGIPFVICDQQPNGGYGAALMAGAARAYQDGFEFGLFMDSDLTNDPALIPNFIGRVKETGADIIKGSRYVPGGGMAGVPFRRQIPSIVGNKLGSFLFGLGIRDVTNGFRMVRLSMLQGFHPKERGFPMIMEELCYLKQKGAKAAELPYILTSRSADMGVTNFSYNYQTIWRYLKYALKAWVQR